MIGERIRDKFASRRKGMWMGGTPPLGYDVRDRKLAFNETEAELVQLIFKRFLRVGSATKLVQELRRAGHTTKSWTTQDGRQRPGKPIDKGAIYKILNNRVYLGEAVHKGTNYPAGEHAAVIDQESWDKVHAILADLQTPEIVARTWAAAKHEIELPEREMIRSVTDFAPLWDELFPAEQERIVRLLVERVDVAQDHIDVRLRAEGLQTLVEQLRTTDAKAHARKPAKLDWQFDGTTITVRIPMTFVRRGGRKVIVAPDGGDAWAPVRPHADEAMIRALVRAHRWRRLLEERKYRSTAELAEAEGLTRSFVNRLLRLTLLAPNIVEAIVEGRQPKGMTLEELTGMSSDWEEQHQLFIDTNVGVLAIDAQP